MRKLNNDSGLDFKRQFRITLLNDWFLIGCQPELFPIELRISFEGPKGDGGQRRPTGRSRVNGGRKGRAGRTSAS